MSANEATLAATVARQAEQLRRYETRLRDVVTAYKGLVKQKEALEASLVALNKSDQPQTSDESVAALTESLATLTAEKSRIEEAFQADRRITKDKYEKALSEGRDVLASVRTQHAAEMAQLVHERELERTQHQAIVKELHRRLNSEEKSTEKITDIISSSDNQEGGARGELEKRVRDLSSELEATQRRLARAESRAVETPHQLVRLHEKMALLQQAHALALTQEQARAVRAEETARRAAAREEERTAELEARVAELSRAAGEYVARGERDRETIGRLQAELHRRILQQSQPAPASAISDTNERERGSTDTEKLADAEYVTALMDKVALLNGELLTENAKLAAPLDLRSVLHDRTAHDQCRRDLQALRDELELARNWPVETEKQSVAVNVELERRVEELRDQLERERDLLQRQRAYAEQRARDAEEAVRAGEARCAELATRAVSLERQLREQRDRHSALLQETDRYLRAQHERAPHERAPHEEAQHERGSHEEAPRVLHYAQEAARRDLELTQLRRDRHALEAQLRNTQRDAAIEKEKMKDGMRDLEEQLDALRRRESRVGANLEYLKNVVVSYAGAAEAASSGAGSGAGSGAASRAHMLNAIAAVLHLTPAERRQAGLDRHDRRRPSVT